MGAQGVPGDQYGIGVKVAAPGPGYRLRVVDGSPHSSGRTHPEYTSGGRRVLTEGADSGWPARAPRAYPVGYRDDRD